MSKLQELTAIPAIDSSALLTVKQQLHLCLKKSVYISLKQYKYEIIPHIGLLQSLVEV
jgi:hypothetical protein